MATEAAYQPEHSVASSHGLFSYMLPNVPQSLRTRIKLLIKQTSREF